MACKGCPGTPRATVKPKSRMIGRVMAVRVDSASVESPVSLKIQYLGTETGAHFKGPSGTLYTFSAGDAPKWVLQADYDGFFKDRKDFGLPSDPSGPLMVSTQTGKNWSTGESEPVPEPEVESAV
jgi:hypothetical protein